ncbi:MAG: hypothetical protein K2H04_00770, partial [Bacteroidaceae bacterium]|nr:hypothetical protein [Bacteroidaceae bacterium]
PKWGVTQTPKGVVKGEIWEYTFWEGLYFLFQYFVYLCIQSQTGMGFVFGWGSAVAWRWDV